MNLLEAVNAELAGGRFDRAAELAAQAIEDGQRHPDLLNVLAFRHSEAGRLEDAVALLAEALRAAPRDPHILYSMGFCLSRLGRDGEAMAAFDASLAALPGFPAPLNQKGLILERRGDDAQAERFYRQASAGDPRFEDPHAGLASLAATRGDFAAARGHAARALALAPRQSTAHLAIAKADFADGQFEAVVSRLEPVLADPGLHAPDRPAFLALLGDALHALGRPAPAFGAWAEGKRLAREQYAATGVAEAARVHLDRLETLRAFAETLPPFAAGPRAAPGPAAPREHVFLVGFPRSGTTLLEQVLASHADVVTLEEKPLLEAAETEYLISPDSFRRLIHARDAELEPFRALYWRGVADLGLQVAGKVFLDKFPLSSLLLPLIARLFPAAKILFAERDPRDVVLSCFRRGFRMNAAMYQFTTLEGAARFYDRVMTLTGRYRRLIPLPVRPARYEALVADFEGECRAVCAFVGMDFSETMLDFAARAQGRSIHTPSAAQVRKGLYTEGIGQWRTYAGPLAPIMPILAPWVTALDYQAD